MKIVLAYSGGLDTSVLMSWIKDKYNAEMIGFCADIGQEEELHGLEKKALKTGASRIYIDNLQEEFARDFIYPMIRAGAIYEGQYFLGTSIARPLIAKRMVEIARKEKADAIAHGATGKGNDQVRFELTAAALAPEIHQVSAGSSDIVYGAELTAVIPLLPTGAKVLAYNDATLWRYNRDGNDLGTTWKEVSYNDSAWPSGVGPMGENPDHSEVVPIRTFVSRRTTANSATNYVTLYVRGHFSFPGTSLTGAKLSFTHQVDDGAVFYLNGVEVNRFGLAAGAPFGFRTLFADHEANAISAPIDIPITNAVLGDNVFAAEIHQASLTSSDIVFGAEVTTTTYSATPCDPPSITYQALAGRTTSVHWINGGTLEWAPVVSGGTWTSTGNASGYFSEPATNAARFYRARR